MATMSIGKNDYPQEPVSKRSILVKIKTGENFNHRHTLSIPRIKNFCPTQIWAKRNVLKLAHRLNER
jgi:hypothetical protein